jgi:hypothetical protein
MVPWFNVRARLSFQHLDEIGRTWAERDSPRTIHFTSRTLARPLIENVTRASCQTPVPIYQTTPPDMF